MLHCVILLALAPFVGSFLGVLIRRLPAGEPVAWARSTCESCGVTLSACDLVPVGSYLVLGGRCRACHAPIPIFHPVVELLTLGIAIWATLEVAVPARLWAGCILGWGLLALAWIDCQHLRLPDALTLPLVPLGLAVTLWLEPDRLVAHAAGAAIGYLLLRGFAGAHRHFRGHEGLGQGDAKLLAVAGAWVGWEALPIVVLLAAVFGIGAALAITLHRGSRLDGALVVPFGPSLSLALWLVWLHGDRFLPAGL